MTFAAARVSKEGSPMSDEKPLTEGIFWRFFEADPDDPPVVINEDTGEEL